MGKAKGKKQWRKQDDSAIVGVIAKESKDQLRGVDFHGVGDADLFVLDTDQRSEPAGPPSSSGKSRRELKKEQARSKMTRAQAILSESQAGKTVPKGPKPSEKQALALPRQVQKAALASGPKKRKAPAPPVEDNDAVEADVWVSGSDGEGGRRRRVVSKPNRPKIRAVEVDMPGCSYNPREDDHEDAIARAVAKEMAKELRKVLEPAAPPKHLIGPPPDELDGLVLYEPDEPAAEGAEAEAEEEEEMPVEQKKKTKAERNKEKRVRELEKALEAKREIKRQRRELSNLKELRARLEEEEKDREARRIRRQTIREEKEESAPPRLGKHRYEGDELRVMLSEELTGSLRQVKQEGLLLKDRFQSLQKRGVVEVRKLQTKRRPKNKRTVFTQGERSEKALERQVEIQEMMKHNRMAAKAADE